MAFQKHGYLQTNNEEEKEELVPHPPPPFTYASGF